MEELPPKKDRIKGQSYLYQGIVRIWDGKELKCEHNRRRIQCKECGGSEICEHQKRRSKCKDCGGSSICEHNRQRSRCKDCGGSEICEHQKRRSTCKDCGGSSLCKSSWCSTRAIKKYEGYCLSCFVNNPENAGKTVLRNYKTKELHVVEHIKKVFPNHQWVHDKRINGGCSKKRPDLMIDLLTHVIVVEVDENQHEDYDTLCDNMRTMQLSQDNAHRPTIFIRFNPDGYIKDGKKVPSCFHLNSLGVCVVSKKQTNQWNLRLEELEKTIEKYLIFNEKYKTVQRINLFYDK